MGMPITVEIVDDAPHNVLERVFNYFAAVDERFSLYKETSEITALNKRRISYGEISLEMREVLELAKQTKRESQGYFEIRRSNGELDPIRDRQGLGHSQRGQSHSPIRGRKLLRRRWRRHPELRQ